MKIAVRALGHISRELGTLELELDVTCLDVRSLIKLVISNNEKLSTVFEVANEAPSVKPGFLVFVNGIDYRILTMEKATICREALIDIIPVIHHG